MIGAGSAMGGVADAFWRAAAYCLHPRVVLRALLPLALAGALVGAAGWLYWEAAVAAVRSVLEETALVAALLRWLERLGAPELRALLAPLVVVAMAVPAVVLVTLLLVGWLVTPGVVDLVATRRFPLLERRHGAGLWATLGWSLACTAAAAAALLLSVPLWFVPPLVLVLPPLIWGWLACRVFAFDVLAEHATPAERRRLLRRQRWPLWSMGVACGFLGGLPSLVWAAGAVAFIFAPLLVLVSVWLYTGVFAFAACWFAHFCLAALERQRAADGAAAPPAPPAAPPHLLPPATAIAEGSTSRGTW